MWIETSHEIHAKCSKSYDVSFIRKSYKFLVKLWWILRELYFPESYFLIVIHNSAIVELIQNDMKHYELKMNRWMVKWFMKMVLSLSHPIGHLLCGQVNLKQIGHTSIPFIKCWNSGQIRAFPAYAASIWSHTFSLAHTSPSSCILSKEQQAVVPRVATTLHSNTKWDR